MTLDPRPCNGFRVTEKVTGLGTRLRFSEAEAHLVATEGGKPAADTEEGGDTHQDD